MREFTVFFCAALLFGCGKPQPDQDAPPKPTIQFQRATADEVAHGARIADVLGCTGCHGKDLQGKRFRKRYASNLTRDVAKYTDPQLERVLRLGVPPDGRDLWGMPSKLFQHLSAPDMAALIAYLRTLEPAGAPTKPALPFPADVRQRIAKGEIKPAAATVHDAKAIAPLELGPTHELGRYIARVTCAECHGPELKGGRDTPDLMVAGAYSGDEFQRLMIEGIGTGGRKLKPMMERVSKGRFSKMTPLEREALYRYLKKRAEQPQ